MNPSQLRETVMDPETRQLVKTIYIFNRQCQCDDGLTFIKKECSSKKRMARKKGITCKDLIMTKDKFDSISLKKYAEDSYLNYAMYVILDRALPNIGDVSSQFKEEFYMQCPS